MKHAVIDLETLDVNPGAVVLSIGVVAFDPTAADTMNSISKDRVFYSDCEIDSQLLRGATTNQGTMAWWIEQIISGNQLPFDNDADNKHTLQSLNTWFRNFGTQYLWGNGSSFDNTILRSMFERYGVPWELPYYADRDMRTIVQAAEIVNPGAFMRPEFIGTKHRADDDAKNEALLIQNSFRALGV